MVTTIALVVLSALAAPAVALPEVGRFGPAIDAYARYEGQSQCISTEQPGVRDFRALVMAAYPSTRSGTIVRACHIGGRSEHKEGRAWDWMVDARNATERRQADELLAWLLATDEHGNSHAMARRFGIMYIIWNGRVWNAYRPHEGWRAYTGANPHTDHVHFSFSWAGARQQTSYWTHSRVLDDSPASCAARGFAFAGDWNNSGRDGLGWWCDGQTILRDADGQTHHFTYGRKGDVPVIADWDGNGTDTVSVVRDGVWHVNNDLRGGAADRTFTYGRVAQGDVPIAGSWDGGSRSLPGIIRDTDWHLRDSQSGGTATWQFTYGRLTSGDLPLWGDWTGDGTENVAIVRDGEWHLRNRHGGGPADTSYVYGRVRSGDRPVMGDWNGDGVATPGIVRDGQWHLRHVHRGGKADTVIDFPAP